MSGDAMTVFRAIGVSISMGLDKGVVGNLYRFTIAGSMNVLAAPESSRARTSTVFVLPDCFRCR